jgi:transcriptional regulator with GAF, ATPase, and Fis domain
MPRNASARFRKTRYFVGKLTKLRKLRPMPETGSIEERTIDEEAAFRAIVQGTSTGTGEKFFTSLVENLADVLKVHGAWVTEFSPDTLRLKAFAFRLGDGWVDDYEYDIKGTPCEPVIESEHLFHVPEKVIELYPDDSDLAPINAVSYMGVPLKDVDGNILGHLAVLDNRPMPKNERIINLFQIFAARAAAELQRLKAEKIVREREEKLSRLVNGAMDAIVDLDARLEVSLMNPAAEAMLSCDGTKVIGTSFTDFLTDSSCEKLDQLISDLDGDTGDSTSLWIPGGLVAVRSDETKLVTEATLAKSEQDGRGFYSLILRNVNDRLEAEKQIEILADEKDRLEAELSELREHHEIVGRSKVIRQALQAVEQVAETDASVLLVGETGTGKELFARAIHEGSLRSDRPLVKVNCAAIPANLIESEFFGHEKGAFTGATTRREGRFGLADGGTIFLDEVGELPIELQSKLLRVLQEGEFEPVGGSSTVSVNVRVVAATNRDLQAEIEAGNFREDLFFRLNVFPIEIPPLRERGRDIEHIAVAILNRLAQRMNRPEAELTETDLKRLASYPWPGNVRELQNVLERALITTHGRRIDLGSVIPGQGVPQLQSSEPTSVPGDDAGVLSAAELREFERANFVKALEQCDWKVSGAEGAAALMGMKPTTLTSRLKALGVERPK